MGEPITAVLLVAVLLLLIVTVIMLAGVMKKQRDGGNDEQQLERRLADEFERNRRETALSLGDMARKLDEITRANMESQAKMTAAVTESLTKISQNSLEQNERLSRSVSAAIEKMQESNEKKLDQMRQTVDEKLNATLQARLDGSFKAVSEQLESVNKSLGEMRELSNGVTANVSSLSRVLTNVKSRGTWAEVQLENILDETIPGMYVKNYSPLQNSNAAVEFAVKIPSSDGRSMTYLPVDSKFPMEDYVRLCTATDSADKDAIDAARKKLVSRIKDEAKQINKYIVVPQTTPYAIMYLATEGLYAEVAASPDGLPEKLRTDYNIMIAGPTTITALLSSLAMGFKAVAVNEKANEVRKLLAVTKAQYEKFGNLLERVRSKIDDAGKVLDEAQDRSRIIHKKLRSVEELDDSPQSAALEKNFFEGE